MCERLIWINEKQIGFFQRTTFINTKQPGSLMQNNLVNIEPEDWKRVRVVCTPTFTTAKLKKLIPLFLSSAKVLARNIDEKYIKNKRPVPLKDNMGRMALDVIAKAGFAMDVDTFSDSSPFMHHANEIMNFDISGLLSLFLISFPNFAAFVQRNFGYEFGKTNHHEFFKKVLEDLYEKRKSDPNTKYNDIMNLLMSSAKEESPNFHKDDSEIIFEEASNLEIRKQGISKIELISQCFVLMIAGSETSATTLHFLIYIISKMPDIQEKLRREIDEVIGDSDDINYDHLQKLVYMQQVLQETLRMYSPAPRTNRLCRAKSILEGIEVKPGMIVTVPTFAIHYNPELYPNPEVFDPDRFSPEEKANRDPLSFMPFGAGPRNCIGMKLAELEIKTVLAFLLRHYRFQPPPNGPVSLFIFKRIQ